MKEKDYIRITYNAKPNVPNKLCHIFPIYELTIVRTMKFDIKETEKAWKFLLECTSPVTKFTQILHAFGYKRGKQILDVINDDILNERGKLYIKKEIKIQYQMLDLGNHPNTLFSNLNNEMVDLKYALNLP